MVPISKMQKDRQQEDDLLEELVSAVAGGDEQAWANLWQLVEPRLLAIIRKPRFLGALSGNEDEVRNIFVEVMARISDDNHRRLKMYKEKRIEKPEMRFMWWLIVVAKRVAIDYVRAHDEFITKRHNRNPESAAGAWVPRGEMPRESRLGARPPITEQGTALQMMSYAGHTLPTAQREALKMWVQNEGYSRIADKLELPDAKAAEKLVRAALSRLRRHFRDRGDKS
jgi:DNA-directed RNA polymerase specialized sigma24 family protein